MSFPPQPDLDRLTPWIEPVTPAEPDEQAVDHTGLIAALRAAAFLLELANTEYDYDVNTGKWSPQSLRYEADYLEKHN
jgi:hypothetical protein